MKHDHRIFRCAWQVELDRHVEYYVAAPVFQKVPFFPEDFTITTTRKEEACSDLGLEQLEDFSLQYVARYRCIHVKRYP